MFRSTIIIAAATALLSVASGCLVVSGKSIDESGVKVSGTTLSQVEPGKTTVSWIIAALGQPSARTPVTTDPNIEILRYDYKIRKSSSGTVFLLFSGESENESKTRTYFEITDGVVSKYWTES